MIIKKINKNRIKIKINNKKKIKMNKKLLINFKLYVKIKSLHKKKLKDKKKLKAHDIYFENYFFIYIYVMNKV